MTLSLDFHGSPSKRDWSRCCYCGIESGPLTAKDLPLRGPGGYAWCLVAACADTRACGQRIRERDAHMDKRYELTPAGRQALQFVEQGEQLRLGKGVA